MWIISINGEEPITETIALDKLQRYWNQWIKSKVNISLCQSKSYQWTDLEELQSRFDQILSVVLNIEVCLPENPLTPITLEMLLRAFRVDSGKKLYFKNMIINIKTLSDTILVKSLPFATKFLQSFIGQGIK